MANVRHRNITEGEKHEPKNFGSGSVYSRLLKDENSQSRYAKESFLEPALNFLDGNGTAPTSPTIGDIYVLIDEGNGAVDASWDDADYHDWVRYNGVEWVAVTPTSGNVCANLTTNEINSFDGATWGNLSDDLGSSDLTQSDAVREYDVNAKTSLDIVNGATKLFRFFTDKIQSLKRLVVGSGPDDESAILAINVNDKGLLIPRGTKSDMDGIATPANGLLFQRTDDNNAIYSYSTDLTAWVKKTAEYGIIEVIRDSDGGIPNYFSDLQSAIDTISNADSYNFISVFSKLILNDSIDIVSNSINLGGAKFKSLVIDFKKNLVDCNYEATTDTFNINAPDNFVTLKNAKIIRTNATGGIAINVVGDTKFNASKIFVDGGDRSCLEVANGNSDMDLGWSEFTSSNPGVNGKTIRLGFQTNAKNFKTYNTGTGYAFFGDGNIYHDFIAEGVVFGALLRTLKSYNFRTYGGTDRALIIDNANNESWNFHTETNSGLAFRGGNSGYGKLSNFTAKADTGIAFDNFRSGEISHFNIIKTGEGNAKAYNGNDKVEMSHGKIISNATTRFCADFKNHRKNKISFVEFISLQNLSVRVYQTISAENDTIFKNCSFTSRYDNSTGHSVDVSGLDFKTIFENCTFEVVNDGANNIFSNSAVDIDLTNSTLRGATTAINANLTVTASTDLGNGNKQI